MAVIIDGVNTYTERGGKRELVNPENASMKMGDDDVFRFDGKSGLLELSMSQSDIDLLVEMHGGLPIAQMHIPAPFEQPLVQNVEEIRPLLKKDGAFLLAISTSQPETPQRSGAEQQTARCGWRGWLRRFLG